MASFIDPFTLAGICLALSLVGAVAYFLYKRRRSPVTVSASSDLFDIKREVIKVVPFPVAVITGQYLIVYLNPAAEALFDSPMRRSVGLSVSSLFILKNSQTKNPLRNFLEGSDTDNAAHFSKSISCVVDYNRVIDADMNVTIETIGDSPELGHKQYAIFLEDMTATKRVENQLRYLRLHDSQTGLLSRNAFELKLRSALDDSRKHGSTHVFATLSIDQFKTINDTLGYDAGESLLKKVSAVLKKILPSGGQGISGRLSGNEFGVMFRESTVAAATHKMKLIREEIAEFRFDWNSRKFSVTLSGGFVVIQKGATSVSKVLTESDIACRAARNSGGNRILAFRKDSKEMRQEQSSMEGLWELKQAFENDSFQLYAQPIHPLKQEEFAKPYYHYELLIRMFTEDGRFVPPDDFIPVAEYFSMMNELDRWVVKEAFRHISKIKQADPLPVFSINLSGQSLCEFGFLDYVLNLIQESKVDPKMVCFEITEAVAVGDMEMGERFIKTLKALGSSFALDDFGTGVSSYGYLQSLDVDYLKIDGIFVKELMTDKVSRDIVQSVTQVGHTMNLKVVAEYVENDKIMAVLRGMGVDYGQGYGISRPKPIEEMIAPHI
ncbi:sensor domain-containing protein [Leucothrix arctica]|uniref:GGDEF-domain containing protein n=1 Tax=Leucothrix arctica TaxID=1481894 RepID=A0A317C6E9_9GAMM|nr:EAL domain-containing protein [Leucothrix arctica]PWQ94194.1 GGDEF-domain containing protein [Leucothrix arctica]